MAFTVKQGKVTRRFNNFILGSRALTRKLKKIADKEFVDTLDQEMGEAAERVFDKSQELVPVRTGNLKKSGTFGKNKREKLLWQVEYGDANGHEAPYALLIHENPFNFNFRNGQAHYVQEPLEQEISNIQTQFKKELTALFKKL